LFKLSRGDFHVTRSQRSGRPAKGGADAAAIQSGCDRQLLPQCNYFLSYLATREIALGTVTPTDVADYLRLSVRQFRKRHGRAPARYWIGIPRSGIHGLLKLALKRWPPEPAATDVGELLCREICDQYQTWLREQRGLAAASIYALMWEARHFCAR
jgi:integrase/recombinase XerD